MTDDREDPRPAADVWQRREKPPTFAERIRQRAPEPEPPVTNDRHAQALKLYREGWSRSYIAKTLGLDFHEVAGLVSGKVAKPNVAAPVEQSAAEQEAEAMHRRGER